MFRLIFLPGVASLLHPVCNDTQLNLPSLPGADGTCPNLLTSLQLYTVILGWPTEPCDVTVDQFAAMINSYFSWVWKPPLPGAVYLRDLCSATCVHRGGAQNCSVAVPPSLPPSLPASPPAHVLPSQAPQLPAPLLPTLPPSHPGSPPAPQPKFPPAPPGLILVSNHCMMPLQVPMEVDNRKPSSSCQGRSMN